MSKFKKMLTTSGSDLVEIRATNRENDAKEAFNAEKMEVEKQIREINAKIVEMEDMAVRSTDALVVGENVDMTEWVNNRINYELQLNDLNVEKEIIDRLISKYFEDNEK